MPASALRAKSRVDACRCHAPRVFSVHTCCSSAQLYIKCHIPSRDAPIAVKSRRGRRSAGECADPPLWLRGSLLLAAVLVCASFQIPWPTGCCQRLLGASGAAVRSLLPGQAAFAVVACRHAPSLRGEGRILRKRMEVQCVPSQAPGARSLLRWPPGESWAAPLARCRAGTPCSPPVGAHGASPPRLLCVHISVWNPRAVGGCAGAGASWLLWMAPRCGVGRAAHSLSCDLPPGPLWGWWWGAPHVR